MNQIDADIQAELDAIRRDFESRLGETVAAIADAWAKTGLSPDPAGGLKNVGELAHSLAGNAGILGLSEVSRAAKDVEIAIDQRLAAPEKSGDSVENISALIDKLRATAQA